MKFDYTLTLASPYHSPPVSGPPMVVTDEGKVVGKAGNPKGLPLTLTYKEPKLLTSLGKTIYFPVIRSLQLVKQFRNMINRDVISSLKARGLTIAKPTTYAGMDVGAASGKPTQLSVTFDQLFQTTDQPIAVFGGGSYSLKSLAAVSDANVLHESLIQDGLVVVPQHFDRSLAIDIEPYQLTFPIPITRRDPIIDFQTQDQLEHLQVIDNYKKAIDDWQTNVTKSRALRKAHKDSKDKEDKINKGKTKAAAKEKDNDDGKKKDLRNMVAAELVLPGISLGANITLPDSIGLAVKGAMISAMDELCREGMIIGGRTSRNCGKMNIQASVDGVLLDIQNYMEEVEAYSQWLETVTPELLAEFYEA